MGLDSFPDEEKAWHVDGSPHLEDQQMTRREVIGYITAGVAPVFHAIVSPAVHAAPPSPQKPMDAESKQREAVSRVKHHIEGGGVKRWTTAADILKRQQCCIDGREKEGVVGVPGGDMGSLYVGFRAEELVSGADLSDAEVYGAMKMYAQEHGGLYMHTDEHAVEHLAQELGMKEDALRRILQDPAGKEGIFMEAFQHAKNLGCGHLKNIQMYCERKEEKEAKEKVAKEKKDRQYPDARKELLPSMLRAYVRLMSEGLARYVVLKGEHEEHTVLQVFSTEKKLRPQSPVPLIAPKVGESSVFLHYPQAVDAWNEHFAASAERLTGRKGVPQQKIIDAMQQLHDPYLLASKGFLAEKTPIVRAYYNERGEWVRFE